MSSSDILSLVSLFFSAFAFVVALLTYVYTVALGPRLKLLFGEELALHYSEDDVLYIWSNFAFFNEGAKPGAIVELVGAILSKNRSEQLRWDSFVVNKNSRGPGEVPLKLFHNEGRPETVVVTGRGIETKGIQLSTDKPFELTKGCYRLELQGLVGPKLTKWCKVEADLDITSEGIDFLSRYGKVKKGTFGHSLHMRRKKQPKQNFTSRLLRPLIPIFEPVSES